MILSDLIGLRVQDANGSDLGLVVDARFVLDGPVEGVLAGAVLHGLIVSPHSHSSFLGYERTRVNAPALIARWLRWRERGSFLVLWPDLAAVGERAVILRPSAVRYSPALKPGRL